MAQQVKWKINSVQQYSGTVGANTQPNHGLCAFDVEQLIETFEASGEYKKTGKHVTVTIPTEDLTEALAQPTNTQIQEYLKNVLAWQLEPWGSVSANVNEERYEEAVSEVTTFNEFVANTWGDYPFQIALPSE